MSRDVSHEPGADELRIRSILRARGIGPDARPPAPPKPAGRPRDWLDDILDTPAPAEEPTNPAPRPRWWERTTPPATPDSDPDNTGQDDEPEPDPEPQPSPPTSRRARPVSPQSLLDAYDGIPGRLRWLVYHATSAAAGWWLGWVDWSTHTAAWYAQGHWTAPSAWVLYGLGACTIALYRRTRTWVWAAAWACSIPASSIVVGVLLYAPNQ